MPFVLDNSIAMAWCFEDEATVVADRVLDHLAVDEALAPAVWPLELANAVLTGERRGCLQPADAVRFLDLIRALPITVDDASLDRSIGRIRELASAQALSAYEASYLELAMREGVALATQDARLRAAATRVGVVLLD